jgi:hypothetical protein
MAKSSQTKGNTKTGPRVGGRVTPDKPATTTPTVRPPEKKG